MTKINFTLEQLRLIVNQMEMIEYSGLNTNNPNYIRAVSIKKKIAKQYHKQNK